MFRTPSGILVLLFCCVIANGIIRGGSKVTSYFQLAKSEKVLAETVANLEKENADIALEIKKLRESPEYARKVLRDKYHVTDKDEKMILLDQ
jgi:cell division protein FtsB